MGILQSLLTHHPLWENDRSAVSLQWPPGRIHAHHGLSLLSFSIWMCQWDIPSGKLT